MAPEKQIPQITGSVGFREIWSLSWPQIIMMTAQFVVGFTSVYVAGRVNKDVQAAMGLGMQCMFFLMIIATATASGGVAGISQARGAKRFRRAQQYVGLLLGLVIACSAISVVLAYVLRHGIFVALQVPEDILALTESVWLILLWTLPANYIVAMSSAICRAHKNVWIPLFVALIMCVCNVFGDFALGLGYWGFPRLGAAGIAWSTAGSLSVGACISLLALYNRKILQLSSFASWRWNKKALPYLVKVALPAAASQGLWQLGYLVLISITASLPFDNVDSLSGLFVGLRIESMVFLPAIAFSMTGSILVGHSLGAGDTAEAKRVGLRVIALGAGGMSVFALFLWGYVGDIAAFLAPEPTVMAKAVSYMHYNLLSTPFTVSSMIFGGIMAGAGATLYTLVVYSTATWFIRLPIAWYMGHIVWQDASGVFLAMLISQIFQACVMMHVFLKCDWYRFAFNANRHKVKNKDNS